MSPDPGGSAEALATTAAPAQEEGAAAAASREPDIWALLDTIADPEIPVISICDLGIVRDARRRAVGVEVTITPTYSGCPAMAAIEHAIVRTLEAAGHAPVSVRTVLAPAWTTDWINPEARERLRGFGIAPPQPGAAQAVRFHRRAAPPPCPRCGSARTQRLAEFASTACKALYRCLDCAEPFDYFKPH